MRAPVNVPFNADSSHRVHRFFPSFTMNLTTLRGKLLLLVATLGGCHRFFFTCSLPAGFQWVIDGRTFPCLVEHFFPPRISSKAFRLLGLLPSPVTSWVPGLTIPRAPGALAAALHGAGRESPTAFSPRDTFKETRGDTPPLMDWMFTLMLRCLYSLNCRVFLLARPNHPRCEIATLPFGAFNKTVRR